MTDLEDRLKAIVRADPGLMQVLTTVRGLGLSDWRIFSGAVYQSVWNAVTGRAPGYGIRDYDLGYFDPDVSWDAEDVVIRRVAGAFAPPGQMPTIAQQPAPNSRTVRKNTGLRIAALAKRVAQSAR